jgi:hypothetical protein
MTEAHTPLVAEAFATGSEIGPIVAKLEEALADVSRTHALIALISVVLLLQHPDISAEEMYEGVKNVSRYTCLWLAGGENSETGEIPKEQMN